MNPELDSVMNNTADEPRIRLRYEQHRGSRPILIGCLFGIILLNKAKDYVLNELEQSLQRGDVVYYKTPPIDVAKVFSGTNPSWQPPEYDIARVVALPGEAIEIRDGQIFNDNKKLDTFYGKALMWGEDEEAFFKNISRPGTGVCGEACQASMKDYFHMNPNAA